MSLYLTILTVHVVHVQVPGPSCSPQLQLSSLVSQSDRRSSLQQVIVWRQQVSRTCRDLPQNRIHFNVKKEHGKTLGWIGSRPPADLGLEDLGEVLTAFGLKSGNLTHQDSPIGRVNQSLPDEKHADGSRRHSQVETGARPTLHLNKRRHTQQLQVLVLLAESALETARAPLVVRHR